MGRSRWSLVLLATFAATLAGCGSGGPGAPNASSPGPGDPTMPPLLAGLELVTITLGPRELHVAIADDPAERRQGLAGTADLGFLDGLLFVYDEPVETGFWMRGVPIALDVAFVGADGRVLDVLTMPVCAADPCPTYRPGSPYQRAVETPAGGLGGVSRGDILEVRGE